MQDSLEFTGERYMPEVGGNIFLEHMHRYRMALQYVAGKDVLDIASGEGFGSNLLATVAARVVGVDISSSAVNHARDHYKRDNLQFMVGSVTEIPLSAASVDVVVSFETIEHIDAHTAMLDEVRRVLRPGGVFIVSTPDKATYTDATGHTNPFHVRELYRNEFAALISSRFQHVTLHGQRIGFGSVIACETAPAPMREDSASTGLGAAGLIDALYLIAVASDDPAAIPGLNSLFSQDIMASEPVLVRVEAELAAYGHRTTAELATLRERLAARDRQIEVMVEQQATLIEMIGPEIEQLQHEIGTFQAANWRSFVSLGRLVRLRIVSGALNRLAKVSFLSERRRDRLLKSAAKRAPLPLSKRVEAFSTSYLAKIQHELPGEDTK
jgi:SAM-dependent methyltransferase